jgi:hypothetical protein
MGFEVVYCSMGRLEYTGGRVDNSIKGGGVL